MSEKKPMHEDEHISEIMLRWDDLRRRGTALSVDELCADRPQLASEVGRRVRAIEQMEDLLGVASPSRDDQEETRPLPGSAGVADAEKERPSLPSLFGYEFLEVLGRGGMGIVYKARQRDLGRTVAVKMIDRSLPGTTQLERFRDEARAIACLHHPSIVQIYDFGEENGVPYFSMEFVDGGNLQSSMAAKPLTPREAARQMEKVARAVHLVHLHGFVHRDLKPANILLTSDGEPKVSDFGLAKELNRSSGHTRTGEVLGTLSYMASEQIDHTLGTIDPRTDVYALGAILYETLAGSPPFTGAPATVLHQVLHASPTVPSGSRNDVPADLEAIAMKCLEKSTTDRYASAEDLANDLRKFLEHKPITARRLGAIRRLVKWARRRPQMVGTAVALVLVAFAAAPTVNMIQDYQARTRLRTRAVELAPQAREILRRNCYGCHGSDPQDVREELDILNHALLLGSERTIVVPGKPDDSRLIQRIADGSMPPEEREKELPRLSQEELTVLNDWIFGGAPQFAATDPQQPLTTESEHSPIAGQVKEIFIARCYKCHKYDEAKGGIKILHHRLLIHVRKVVVPGRPGDSELFQLITSDDEERRMPPPTKHAAARSTRLGAEEIDVIRRWIAAGAPPFPRSP